MATQPTRSIWICGARGMLGSALVARLARDGAEVQATDGELDIADHARVLEFARAERPWLIVNAAAYVRVDDAQDEPEAAFRVNAEGVRCLAEAARDVGARLLHFSTDYVFDGLGSTPYREDDPTLPRSVYGQSKRRGEECLLASLPERAWLVRTSWLFGENGANFVETMLGLMRSRDEVRVVSDQHGRPTYARDLAEASLSLVGALGVQPAEPGVYHFANSEPTSRYGFSLGIRDACQARGVPLTVERIVPVSTAEFPRPAPRPAYSVLATDKIEAHLGRAPRSWRDALREYLAGGEP
ncbi:MAG: dTDP-4-dehydrorhamnose reductase [Polyangiaceae bacterium]